MMLGLGRGTPRYSLILDGKHESNKPVLNALPYNQACCTSAQE